MDFVRSDFNMYAPLFSCPLLSSKLDSPVIKTLERHFFTLSECFSNVLIKGESNFDERNVQEMFNSWSEVHSQRNNFLKDPYFKHMIQYASEKLSYCKQDVISKI